MKFIAVKRPEIFHRSPFIHKLVTSLFYLKKLGRASVLKVHQFLCDFEYSKQFLAFFSNIEQETKGKHSLVAENK